jgi:hypothetical protein
MGALAAYHLLGRVEDGNLILLAGPDHARIQSLAAASGIPYMDVREAGDADELRARVIQAGQSVLVTASMHEIEGRLDRSAFAARLVDFTYGADLVVYAGLNGAAKVWPVNPGTAMQVVNGNLRVSQKLDVVAAGETVTALTVDRL